MKLRGTALKLGDDISTDAIIAGRYKFSITDMAELCRHIFEDIDDKFYLKIKRGKSIVVAGKNFGLGSSREQAPLVIKQAGVVCVLARSFARIFFRNSINIGLPLAECDTSLIEEGDRLNIDLTRGRVSNLSKKQELKIKPLPAIMRQFLKAGGVVGYLKKHRGLKL